MFSVGDIQPYSQLAGTVAGQGAENIMQQGMKGQIDQATLEDALNKATQSDIQTKVALQDAPSAAILKNLQAVQTLNVPRPAPTSDDLLAATDEIAGKTDDTVPDSIKHQMIMSRAQELAQDRAPKLNPMDITPYLANIPGIQSNKEADIDRYKAMGSSREAVQAMRGETATQIAEDKTAWDKDKTGITEAGKNHRAEVMAGSGVVGGPKLANQKFATEEINKFDSQYGLMLTSPMIEGQPKMKAMILSKLQGLLDTVAQSGDKVAYHGLLQRYGSYLQAAPQAAPKAAPSQAAPSAPLGADQLTPQAPQAPADESAQLRAQFANDVGGVAKKVLPATAGDMAGGIGSALSGVGKLITGNPANKTVVTVGGKVRAVGDKVQIGTVTYVVQPNGNLKKAQAGE